MNMMRFCTMLALPALAASPAAQAQNYPTKPVRLVIGFTPGGGVDIKISTMNGEITLRQTK